MRKLPKEIGEVSLVDPPAGPFPPTNFQPFKEASFGNGDYFGLYWPYGREHEEPVVLEWKSEDHALAPRYTDLASFLASYDADENHVESIVGDDPGYLLWQYELGKQLILLEQPEMAIRALERSTKAFPDSGAPFYHLALQYLQLSRGEEFVKAMIDAVVCNWALGVPNEDVLNLLQSISLAGRLSDDPLIRHRNLISFEFGNQAENDTYLTMHQIREEYEARQDFRRALLMHQNFGFAMSIETKTFQENYGFDLAQWREKNENLTKRLAAG